MSRLQVLLPLTVFLLIVVHNTKAQWDPQFSQYMFNKLVYNPAVAGSDDCINSTAALRSQWIGFDGHPVTQTLSLHAPLLGINSGIGMYLVNDKLGADRSTKFMLAYAYRKSFSFGDIAAGISGGLVQQSIDGDILRAPDGEYTPTTTVHNDPFIPDVQVSNSTADFALGVFYTRRDKIFAGFSITNLTEPTVEFPTLTSTVKIKHARTYYLLGGYKYKVSRSLDFTPSLLMKSDGVKTQFDINANVVYNGSLVGGVSWRGITKSNNDGVVILAGINLTAKVYLGYSYDMTFSNIRNYSAGSHEVVLNYCFPLIAKIQPIKIIYCPRFL